ncbi:homeodomain-interacting protein kinase 1-like [Acanthochromis polyacanthus]|uniref:homeodomain-interacting protein kinase 1-like n=1 Tax=Acanthochromis polyacanthus TaxID=80966 RepID=UPI0022342CBF|nr:homeodomain-interacting protein kinase 1-like [Acanthochromis polyacanthus]
MSQLDRYTPKLLQLFDAMGGAEGQHIKNMLMELIQGSTTRQPSKVPEGYTLVKELGHGVYGTVMECVENITEEHVAIKVSKCNNLDHEAKIMKKLMSHNAKESNIIEHKGDIFIENTRLLVLEKLDITLVDYVENLPQPMPLEDVRMVIQQLAVALNATKSAGIIHADVKIENITMVDHVKQPYKVKLIDFGMAKDRSKAKAGKLRQALAFRAPEITLGLPYSEAIDVWSLGCVMVWMMTQDLLFGFDSQYWTLRRMIRLPPQHLIDAGRRSGLFFKKMPNRLWRLKTLREYFGRYKSSASRDLYSYRTVYTDEPRPSTSLSITFNPADPENKMNLPGLPDSEYEESEDSSDYIDTDYNEDSDVEEEKYRENIKAETEKDPVNKEINDYEDIDDADTAADTEDSKDSHDDEDTEDRLIATIVFYLRVLGIGIWASIKSKKDENRTQANHADVVLLGNRKISLVVGIFTTTVRVPSILISQQ